MCFICFFNNFNPNKLSNVRFNSNSFKQLYEIYKEFNDIEKYVSNNILDNPDSLLQSFSDRITPEITEIVNVYSLFFQC